MANTENNKATMWFIAGFIVLITAGLIIAGVYSSGSSSGTSSGFVATAAPAISATDHVLGNPGAKVTLVEYGDFECPACGKYFPVVQQLIANYSSTILFVFRNFPLYQVHPNAGISAQAAEAAALQGKYWQMNDLLYEKQDDWALTAPNDVVSQKFDGYAASLGLDVNKFNADITSSVVLNKIENDVTGGTSAQIDHTPTFFINLQQIQNPNSYDEFKTALDSAIASSSTQ